MDFRPLDSTHGGYISVVPMQHIKPQSGFSVSSSPSSTTSNDDVFSVASAHSSQSSFSDNDDSCAPEVLTKTATTAFEPSITGQHQHPRRICSSTKRPPPLPRQDERKVLFVNDLVDSATNLVTVIWPLSNASGASANSNRGVLPLRRYIEETLRRSRTSYSTLQVALYYLILIKSHIPRHESIRAQSADSVALRVMHCGRRMFLAALILASKYLQDRNYSAKAWSKMSGLQTVEINNNERLFLSAVDFKLHIPDKTFKRWTDIVLRFTASPMSTSPNSGVAAFEGRRLWAKVVPLLRPELDDPRILALSIQLKSSALAQEVVAPSPGLAPSLYNFARSATSLASASMDDTPQQVERKSDTLPPTPGLAASGPLPTPRMSPYPNTTSTPAASACSSRRPSIGFAMAQVQHNMLGRINADRFPITAVPQRPTSLRFPSSTLSSGSWSSPESMVSDATRTSRSSSISSTVAASSSAPHCALARPATCRSSSDLAENKPVSLTSKTAQKGSAEHPITIFDEADFSGSPDFANFNIRDAQMSGSEVTVSNQLRPVESRKRCRPQSLAVVDTDLKSELRHLLSNSEAMEIDSINTSGKEGETRCAYNNTVAEACHHHVGMSKAKGVQPPTTIKTLTPINRIPVVRGDGRKRICSSSIFEQLPDLYMQV